MRATFAASWVSNQQMVENISGQPRVRSLPSSSTLSRRQVLHGAVALAASSLTFGCGSSHNTENSTPPAASNPQPTPAGPTTQASVVISDSAAGSIGANFVGLSYEKSSLTEPLFTASNADLIGLFKRLGTGVLRIGGNSVDRNVWTSNGPGQTAGQIAPGDVASLAAFVKAIGWQCLYGINLGGSATGATSPALAAAEVAYAYQQFGSSLLGIEIGNEPDLYGGAGSYYGGNWTLAQFLSLWGEYRTAILTTTPNVAITGPADSGNISGWTIPFGEAVTKSEISLLTQHFYRGDGRSPASTAAYLVSPDSALVSKLGTLSTGAQSTGVPYRMAECNSFYNGGADGISDSYASTLWVMDYLFNCAQGGASGVNFHGGGDGKGYTPIADSDGAVVEARPEYYGILFFTLAGQGTLYTTQLSAGSLNVTAYAVHTSAGGLNLVVINKDLTNNIQVTAQVPQNATSAALLELTQLSQGAAGPSLAATDSVTIQGAGVNNDGTFSPSAAFTLRPSGNQLSFYVPALSAALIQIV